MLRPGNVHSAERWREVLEPVVKRYQEKGVRLLFRADAAFAKPEVYEYLESRDTGYAMRLPANEVLQRNIRHLLKRPVGRPPKPASPRRKPTPRQTVRWKAVQQAKLRGLSIRAIARELGIHGNTVRKYAEAKSPPMMRTRSRSRVSQSDAMTAA